MIDRPLAYEAMDPQVKLLWESQAQTQLLGEIVELLTPEIVDELESDLEQPEPVDVSEPEVEPTPESVEVKPSKRAGLLARLMGHD